MNYTVYICEKRIAPFMKDNMDEFLKRLSRYCKIQVVLLKKEQDKKKIKLVSGKHYVVTEGESKISSEGLAQTIKQLEVHGTANCNFYIHCAPEGIETEEFSISKLTMDAGITGAILCEQIYRAYRIIHGQPYHK